MLSTIEITPSRVAGFFGYFALLSLLMLPAAVAFARRKTSRWFLLSAGLLLLIGGALNWWGLLPPFSWHGYEPDWPPILCCGVPGHDAPGDFRESQPSPQTAKMKFFRHCLWIIAALAFAGWHWLPRLHTSGD
jgi:hypothetical protein